MASNTLNQIVCSGGLFIAKDTHRFLLLLRNQGKTSGTWGLVGGKKEPADLTVIDALTREIQEEVGKTPVIKKIIPLTGQTVKGYVEIHLKKQVDKDLLKMLKDAIILAKKEINAKESNT